MAVSGTFREENTGWASFSYDDLDSPHLIEHECGTIPDIKPGQRIPIVRVSFTTCYGSINGEKLYQSRKYYLPQGTHSLFFAMKVTAVNGDKLATENLNAGVIPHILKTDFPCSLSLVNGVPGNVASVPWTLTCYQDLISGSSNRPESNNTAFAAGQNLRHAWLVGGIVSVGIYDMGTTHGTDYTGACELWAVGS